VIFLLTHRSSCDLAEYGCAAAGDNASSTPNPKDGKCLNFQRKTERQLKLSKLSTLKGLKLSKMSNHLKSLLLAQGRALVVIGRWASLRTIIRTSVVSISKESPKSSVQPGSYSSFVGLVLINALAFTASLSHAC
jgi:hypothetical protein